MKSVLLVEDNPDDVFIMQRAWKKAGIQNTLLVVEDGQKAIDYFSGAEPYTDRQKYPIPCLVLLDLKLPYRSGHEVVEWMRSNEETRGLAVVFLTASHSEWDIQQAYRLGGNAYLVKPPTAEKLVDMLKALKDFWMHHNQFSPECLVIGESDKDEPSPDYPAPED